jgi:two-component system, chemotaxis family, protein-glutamate methylesterase/glutaminase
VLVVQHMPPGFTKALANRLDGLSELSVREAVAGELVQEGVALFAPGDFHMAVDGSGHVVLSQGAPVHSVRPAADVLLASVAATYGRRALGVVLTGMGHDGAAGATDIKRAGGQVIVQDERTSVIYGMAASVVEAGSADAVVPLPEMASRILQLCPR